MTMTKKDLMGIQSGQTGLSQKECAAAIESTFEIIKDELEKGNSVKISGFETQKRT